MSVQLHPQPSQKGGALSNFKPQQFRNSSLNSVADDVVQQEKLGDAASQVPVPFS